MAQEIWWLRRCDGSGDVVAQEMRWLIEAHRLLGQRSRVRIRHLHNDPDALHVQHSRYSTAGTVQGKYSTCVVYMYAKHYNQKKVYV